MTKQLYHMTPLQRITAKQKAIRLNNVNNYYQSNPGCTMKDAIAYTPPNGEAGNLVQQYSKLRTELVIEGDQDEITAADIEAYVYGPYPLRHRQRRLNGIRTKTR